MVSPFNVFPPRWGAGKRIYSLAVHLSQMRPVSLICNGYPRPISQASMSEALARGKHLSIAITSFGGRASQLANPGLLLSVLRALRSGEFSALFGHFLWSASVCIPASRLYQIPFLLDLHNVESDRLSSLWGLKATLKRSLESFEKLACSEAARVLCVSEPDRRMLANDLLVEEGKLQLVPHGVDTDSMGNSTDREDVRNELGFSVDDPIILFFGPSDYLPNREAVDALCSSIAPRVFTKHPNSRLVVIGRGWERMQSTRRFRFLGYVSDIARFIRAADVTAAPIYRGGGAQLKVVESLACGTPVVTTPFVAARFARSMVERALLIGQDDVEIADLITRLLIDPQQRFDPREIRETLSWEAISRKVNEILTSVENHGFPSGS